MKADVKLNKNSSTFETINDIIRFICNKCNIKPEVEEDENEIRYEFPGSYSHEDILKIIECEKEQPLIGPGF